MREGSGREEERREPGRPEEGLPDFPFSIEDTPIEGTPADERSALHRSAQIPLILPRRQRGPFWRRHQETLLWAFAFLVVGGVLGWALVAPMGDGALAEDDAPAEFRIVPEATGAVKEGAAGAFSNAVAVYRERARDFDLGRLDCADLGRGLRAADEAFVELSEGLTAGGAEGGPAERAHEEARRAMREVERHYETSGCPVESSAS